VASQPPIDPKWATLFAAAAVVSALGGSMMRLALKSQEYKVKVKPWQSIVLTFSSLITAITLGPLFYILIKPLLPAVVSNDEWGALAAFAAVIWGSAFLSENIAAIFLKIDVEKQIKERIGLGNDKDQ
jgi:hypothetical protein